VRNWPHFKVETDALPAWRKRFNNYPRLIEQRTKSMSTGIEPMTPYTSGVEKARGRGARCDQQAKVLAQCAQAREGFLRFRSG